MAARMVSALGADGVSCGQLEVFSGVEVDTEVDSAEGASCKSCVSKGLELPPIGFPFDGPRDPSPPNDVLPKPA